ncbi:MULTISPECIES: hypothetical protein [Ralstonia]|uniref:hypothetical protein n=1 Tax=Ralstonia TaxID=48736 RepID=UPI00076E7586|nr:MULTISPECIES: hypothetical protein [Ralstonia]MBY4708178.1 hypothetical protein [Ralstonia insidiosa]GAQ26446.1 hypothetical protein SAMD00023378_0129 [Ralstonia sp. NT80]
MTTDSDTPNNASQAPTQPRVHCGFAQFALHVLAFGLIINITMTVMTGVSAAAADNAKLLALVSGFASTLLAWGFVVLAQRLPFGHRPRHIAIAVFSIVLLLSLLSAKTAIAVIQPFHLQEMVQALVHIPAILLSAGSLICLLTRSRS